MTGVDNWQSALPRNWTVRPLRSVADYVVSNVDKISSDDELPVRLCNYTDVYNNEAIHLGMEFMAGTASQAEIEKFHLLVDDVVITKDSESWDDIAIPALVTETADNLVCGYHLAVIRPNREKLLGKFVFRCLQAKTLRTQLELAANGITRFGIPKNAIGSMAIPVPPISAQRTIVHFIDRETADIDALIDAKQRLLALLAEKRRAIVAETIMRGLKPSAPMRPSGVAWLGDVPAHWAAIPLRFLVSFSGGATPDTRNIEYWSGTIPWVSPKDMKRDFIEDAEDHVSEKALDNSALKMIEPGAILIVVRGMILAHSFPTATNTVPVTINQDMKALRCGVKVEPAFLVDVLKGAKDYLVSLADSSAHGTKKLETEALGRFEVPVPPIEEQREIVRHIATETARVDRLRAATEHSMLLLKERRGALITAAVTGQIDIPEAA